MLSKILFFLSVIFLLGSNICHAEKVEVRAVVLEQITYRYDGKNISAKTNIKSELKIINKNGQIIITSGF